MVRTHEELSGRERNTRHQRFRCVGCECGRGVIMDQLEKNSPRGLAAGLDQFRGGSRGGLDCPTVDS